MKTLLATTAASVLLLAGCGADEDPDNGDTTASTVGSAPTTSTSAPDHGSSDVGEVRLETTGGVAGVDRVVVVAPDGAVSAATATGEEPLVTGTVLDAEELGALHTAVSSTEFAALEETYVPEGLCCDQFNYTVTATVDGDEIVSATADGVETPEVLQRVVDQLSALG